MEEKVIKSLEEIEEKINARQEEMIDKKERINVKLREREKTEKIEEKIKRFSVGIDDVSVEHEKLKPFKPMNIKVLR